MTSLKLRHKIDLEFDMDPRRLKVQKWLPIYSLKLSQHWLYPSGWKTRGIPWYGDLVAMANLQTSSIWKGSPYWHNDLWSRLLWLWMIICSLVVIWSAFPWSCMHRCEQLHFELFNWFCIRLAVRRWLYRLLSPFAMSCSAAMKLPWLTSSMEKSTLSSRCPLKGSPRLARNSTAKTIWLRTCLFSLSCWSLSLINCASIRSLGLL